MRFLRCYRRISSASITSIDGDTYLAGPLSYRSIARESSTGPSCSLHLAIDAMRAAYLATPAARLAAFSRRSGDADLDDPVANSFELFRIANDAYRSVLALRIVAVLRADAVARKAPHVF